MVSYSDWNKAIIEYFVGGLPAGASVYLSVDEDALIDIGRRFLLAGSGNKDWVEDFLSAVRAKCVVGEEVCLARVRDAGTDGLPKCVAFLGAMVLAAHRMADEQVITENNYFTPLRRVLGLTDVESGRPRGLQSSGVEESLWLAWNHWIIRRGFLPSAERGRGRAKYIHYPLSQALLREGDKRRLARVFRESARSHLIRRDWDKNKLLAWLRMNVGLFNTQHLKELFQEADPTRYEAIVGAVFRLYDTLDWAGADQQPISAVTRAVRRRLMAGLYRVFDPLTGSISYLLYPREPEHWDGSNLHVLKDSESHPLREERSGWFMPLWPEDPSGGKRYEVRGSAELKEIILPESDFWIFVRDPENEDSGVLAIWRRPVIFENFVLLCRKERIPAMETLRQAGLLSWDHEFHFSEHNLDWVEYRECVITSLDWDKVLTESNDLFDSLHPSASAVSIALRGGLRFPNQRGWLEGYGPEVVIHAIEEQVRLVVRDIVNIDVPIMDRMVNANKYLELHEVCSGNYTLQVYRGSRLLAQQAFRILPWKSLGCSEPEKAYSVRLGTFTLQGAIVRVEGEGSSD